MKFHFPSRHKYRFLKPGRRADESVLERPEFMYPDQKSAPRETGRFVNYLRKPRSETGTLSVAASAVALVLTALAFRFMVTSLGNPPLYVTAVAGSAMLFSLYALIAGITSLFNPDRDHLFGIIGLSIGGLVLLTWIIIMIFGMTQGSS